jgi:dTDP-4-amino-4,6-dideoxygalactose transaminase
LIQSGLNPHRSFQFLKVSKVPIYTNQSYYGATVAQDLWKSGLCLPSGTGMSDEDLIRIESTLKDYFKV